jgi:hypothetical protein
VKRRNKFEGERTYLMTGRIPLKNLANWQEEGGDHQGVVWVTVDLGKRKINKGVKAY